MLQRARNMVQKLATSLVEPIDRRAYAPFYNMPFGNQPKASAQAYTDIWNRAREQSWDVVDQYEQQSGFAIDSDWMHDLALLTQVVIKKSEICYQHGRLLYSALSGYARRQDVEYVNILETGTARGFSSLCMARALDDAGVPGKIVTFDILPHDIPMYWNCIADKDGPRTRAELLAPYADLVDRYVFFVQGDSKLQLNKVKLPRINFAFLDGAHTYDHVLAEFAHVRDKQQPGDMIFFDDYTPSLFPGIVQAVDEICDRYGYDKTPITVSEQRGYVIAVKA